MSIKGWLNKIPGRYRGAFGAIKETPPVPGDHPYADLINSFYEGKGATWPLLDMKEYHKQFNQTNMKQLLERILTIISIDDFADGDKPYIIREVVEAYLEGREEHIPSTNDGYQAWFMPSEYLEHGKQQHQEGYDDGHEAGYKKGDLEGYGKGFNSGYNRGYNEAREEAEAELQQQQNANKTWYDEKYVDKLGNDKYNEGFEDGMLKGSKWGQRFGDERWDSGYLKGVSDAEAKLAPKHAAEVHDARKEGFDDGHSLGYERGHGEGHQKGVSNATAELAAKHARDLIEAENKAYQECAKEHGSADGTLSGIRKNGYDEGYRKGFYDANNHTYDDGVHIGIKNGLQQAINLLTMEMESK